jgi:hypothetical protein
MQVKTLDSQQVWQSPDREKIIWGVTVQGADGKKYGLKTYSPRIAGLGFEGEVETYINKHGDRFVRQQIKERQFTPVDANRDASIRAQWAIGQAIALASATMEKQKITMPAIEKYAKELFATVSRVKGEPVTNGMMNQAERYIKGYTRQPQGA